MFFILRGFHGGARIERGVFHNLIFIRSEALQHRLIYYRRFLNFILEVLDVLDIVEAKRVEAWGLRWVWLGPPDRVLLVELSTYSSHC